MIDYAEGPDAPQESVDLRPEHAQAALDNLLGGTRLPALAWALWWMRDYGFRPGFPPDKQPSNVINAFRTIFRFNDTPDVRLLNATGDFDLLFESPSASALAQPVLVEPK
ncbi:hypothetical protein [Pseudokineococcus sp. 1T1Z-3]|uniref:hypothetical protein n=1 Tax=Pseudokineococcus sp. 1T1Z-3 TaxID=3132745 RepID=UPI0030B6D664